MPPHLFNQMMLAVAQQAAKIQSADSLILALPLLEWMARYRSFLIRRRPFDLNERPYLKAIYSDQARRVSVQKAGQMGISEYMLSFAFWACDQLTATTLYIFPSEGLVSDFSTARIGPAIESSEYLNSIVMSGGGDERGADRVKLKRVRDRFLYLRGGKVDTEGKAAQLKSVDADVLLLDEVDELDSRAIPLAEERLGNSALSLIRVASTPTYAGFGINKIYQDSDQRVWFVRCSACGDRQALGLENFVLEMDALERPARWFTVDQTDPKSEPRLGCRKCSGAIDVRGGEWVATYPDRDRHGYHVTGLLSPVKSLVDLLEGLSSTDETKRQQAWNQKLGLTYRSSTSQSLTEDTLNKCCREYVYGPKPGKVFCGIDVGRVLNIVIRGADGTQRYAAQVQSFTEAGRLMDLYGVSICVVDALPETRAAREFQSKHGRRVWLAYYGSGKQGLKDVTPADWNIPDQVVNIDRTRALDAMFSKFMDASLGKDGWTLPANAKSIPDYYAQMCAPERKLVDGPHGEQVAIYIESGPDHYAHAENYAYVAGLCPILGGWSWKGTGA